MCELVPGARLDLDELRSSLRDALPGPALPRELVVVDALPRDRMGKVSRAAVRDLLGQR